MTFLYDGKLNELDFEIAAKVERNPYIVVNNNIYYAAKNLDISPSKLTKYCQKIKLSGFKEFKFKLQEELYQQNLSDLNFASQNNNQLINECIKAATLKNLYLIEEKIIVTNRVLVVDSDMSSGLARYLCYRLRKTTNKDVIYYDAKQNFSHEFVNQSIVVIVIDAHNQALDTVNNWYRRGHQFFHICSRTEYSQPGYYPILINNANVGLGMTAKVVTILDWIVTERLEIKKSD